MSNSLNWQQIFNRELVIDLGSSHLAVGSSHEREPLRVAATMALPPAKPRPRRGAVGVRPEDDEEEGERVRHAVRHGMVADPEALDLLLDPLLGRVRRRGLLRPVLRTRVGLLTPPVLDEEARTLHRDVALRHGLSGTRLVSVSEALARGTGLDGPGSAGRMVIDIGGGKVCVAACSLGGVVSSHWSPFGGQDLDAAVAGHVLRRYRVRLPAREAERVKLAIGSVYPFERPRRIDCTGPQTRSGSLQTVQLDDDEVRDVLVDGCEALVRAIEQAFRGVPPELAGDIADSGIVLSGGGALLAGLPRFLAERTGLNFRVAEDPMNVAIRGAQRMLRHWGEPVAPASRAG